MFTQNSLQNLNKNKIEYEASFNEILKEEVEDLERQIAEKKGEGEDIYNEMRDKISHQEDTIIDVSERFSLYNNDRIP